MPEQATACKICTASIPETHFVFADDYWRIRHSQETRILGYIILEPLRHILDLAEASPAQLRSYGQLLSAIMKVQKDVLHCERIYTFSLAEAVPHYHLHVIPRGKEFPRAYKGRGIMSYPTVPACDSSLVSNLVQVFRAELLRFLARKV